MRKSVVFSVILVLAATVLVVSNSWATPPNIAIRGNFTQVFPVGDLDVMSCPLGPCLSVREGIDSQGPYFAFNYRNTATTFTYRPRNDTCGSCSVAQFGDGRIHAVKIFREQFERFARGGRPAFGLGPCAPAVGRVCNGPGGFPCDLGAIAYRPGDVMLGPDCLTSAVLMIVLDPATNCFEDYEFNYATY